LICGEREKEKVRDEVIEDDKIISIQQILFVIIIKLSESIFNNSKVIVMVYLFLVLLKIDSQLT
jgi:hypothetical protein